MSKNNQSANSVASELERLRDILYGEYARDTGTRLADLEAELLQFRQQTNQSLESQSASQSNQLEVTRQEIEDKLTQLTDHVNQQFADLRRDMEAHFARVEDALTNRRVLGRLLSDLSHELIGDRPAEGETEAAD